MNPFNESPDQPNEPPKQPSSVPQSADQWPSSQEPIGDIEPSTQPTPTPYSQASVQQPQPFNGQPASEPTSDVPPAVAPVLGSQTRRGKKKPLTIALIIAAVLIVLGGASAAAYTWYQNPQKVVTDSIAKLLTAKTVSYTGTIDSKSDTTKLAIALDGAATQQMASGHAKATIAMGAASVVAEGNLMADKDGNWYFKIVNAKDIAATLLQGLPTQSQGGVDSAIAKINDRWIKFTPADLNIMPSIDSTKKQQCSYAALNRFQTDGSYRSDVVDQYSKHQFINITENLGEKNGSLGYKLALDLAKEKAFLEGATHTKLYADLQKCDSTFKLDSSTISNDTTGSSAPEVELWADKWSHSLTKLVLANPSTEKTDTYNVTVNPKFDQNVTIDVPKDAMTLDQLKTELAPLFGGMFDGSAATTAGVASNAETVKNQTNAILVQKKVETYNAESTTGYPTFAQLMKATGDAQLPSDVKGLMVNRTAASGSEVGLVPCSNATKGGSISYINTATGAAQTIEYGSC